MAGVQADLPSGVLQRLQSGTVRALLGLAPLPGGGPVHFPDLPFLLRQPWIPLLDENLAGPISLGEGNVQLRVVSPEQLREELGRSGELSYLRFAPPAGTAREVRLTLEVRAARPGAAGPALGLGGLVVTFTEQDGAWRVTGAPSLFAT
jgi:hypothetical protein